MDHLPSQYPYPIIKDGNVFFITLKAFEVARSSANDNAGQSITLNAQTSRVSAPYNIIYDQMALVPFFHKDNIFCGELSFVDKARFVYLASLFDKKGTDHLYNHFKAFWLNDGSVHVPLGCQVTFLKNGVEDMIMDI
tara:strand:+ start:123 stop:533 length:411 start_codon:yes stop_codon:yes gene_type:complete